VSHVSSRLFLGPEEACVQRENFSHPGGRLLNIESNDVQGDLDRLKAAGAIVIREPYSMEGWPADSKVAALADPDDNYFQLQTPYEMGNDQAG